MGATSFWHIAIVALVIVLLFGRGKISDLMGDVAKGIKSFKQGLSDEDRDEARAAQPAPRLTATAERAPEHRVASDEPVKG
jgi:sec-independent protein translocase protein TatA